ncbi:MAG: DUF4255 domain-containing protein [Anaerolineae bacterium]
MSVSSVIGDVTETLEELLKNEQRPPNSFTISLKSPAEETIEPSMKPKVNLFLFRVTENPFAKNQPWQATGPDRLQGPPLALNLFYVMTPIAEDKLDEHRVLGEAMRIFHDHSLIDVAHLKGSLAHTSEEIKIDLIPLTLEDLTRIWNALNKPYRLSVGYEVRVVMVDSGVERTVGRVTEREDRFSQVTGD